MLCRHFDQARTMGILKPDADSDALSRLVMSSIEGALMLCKASKDTESFKKTAEALKSMISSQRIH